MLELLYVQEKCLLKKLLLLVSLTLPMLCAKYEIHFRFLYGARSTPRTKFCFVFIIFWKSNYIDLPHSLNA
jgi:hypothetical protein